MGDRRFTDFGAKSGNPSLTDMLLLSDASNNYAYLTLQRLRTWIREEVTRSDTGTCSTAVATSAKTATLSDFKQADGKTVLLTFENAVGSGATLSINSTTAKPIFYHGAPIGDGVIGAGDTALLVYDTSADSGSGAYELITVDRAGSAKPDGGWLESDLAAAVQAKLNLAGGIAANTEAYSTTTRSVNIDGYVLEAGALVTVRFSNKLKANTKLRVSPDGGSTYTTAKTIYYGTAAIGEDVVQAGMTVTFRYDGSYYRIIAMTPGYIAPGSITAAMLAMGVAPGLHYYASTAAYNQDAANVPEGDYILLLDSGAMSLYRRTSSSRTLICTWPSGSNGSTGETKIYGFSSIEEYNTFRTANPTTIKTGDYVWVRGGDMTHQTHVLYIYNTDAPYYNLAAIYRIDDSYPVTVTYANNAYSIDHTFAQIVSAYEDGKKPVLIDEYGHRLPVTKYDSTASTPYIVFSGATEHGGTFWVVSYVVTASGVTPRGVMTDFIPVVLSESGGVYDVSSWPDFISGIGDIVAARVNGANVCLVIPGSYDAIIHPMTYYYGAAEIRFSGHEIVTVNSVEVIQEVTYVISAQAAHVRRIVRTTLPVPASGTLQSPSTDKDKVPTVDAYGNFVLQTPSCGSGVNWASAPTAQQAGYILVAGNDGTASWTQVSAWTPGGNYGTTNS